MKLHEYQSKQIFSNYGVPIPSGRVAANAADVKQIAEELGGNVVNLRKFMKIVKNYLMIIFLILEISYANFHCMNPFFQIINLMSSQNYRLMKEKRDI